MNFKDEVNFYLNKQSKDYYGFDLMNDNIWEEEETCPKCGKTKKDCKCKGSVQTKTHGEEDDGGNWHASVPADFGATPEEIEMIKLIKKNKGLGKFNPETPEEKEMLKLAMKIAGNASVDDKTAGFAPSCQTKNIKEEILKNI